MTLLPPDQLLLLLNQDLFAEAESVSPLYRLANSKLQFVAFLGAKLEQRRSPPDCCSYDRRSIKNLTAD